MNGAATTVQQTSKLFNGRLGYIYLAKLVCSLMTLTSITACSNKTEGKKEVSYVAGHIYAYEKGAPIPDHLVTMIEKDFVKKYRLSRPDSSLSDVEIAMAIPRRLIEIEVFLREKNEGTLTANTKFNLPAGGAAIDLAEFVQEGKGIFYTQLKPDLEAYEIDPKDLRVYFVSNSHKFDVHSDTFGSGCGVFFEITEAYQALFQTGGYELAAADKRYLGQILGTFYFVAINLKGIYVGATSFIDTRYPKVHCLPPQAGGAYQ